MSELLYILSAVLGIGLGIGIDRFMFKKVLKRLHEEEAAKASLIVKEAQIQAERVKQEAENTKNQRMLEAKEKYLRLKAEFEEESNKKKQIFLQNETKLKQQQQEFSKQVEKTKRREEEIDKIKENLLHQAEQLTKRREEVEHFHAQQVQNLEKIAGLTAEEARQQLVNALREEAQTQASAYVRDILEEAKLTAAKQAKKVVIETIQRTASEHTIENAVSIFNIESDEIKGKIIGREGRNIRALEAATGVEIIVDDTPEAIIISGFDPVRREIARLSLQKLVADGRIHPARIEEIVAKTTKAIDDEIIEIGERTAIDLGIHGLHPELIKLVGRMRYRSSYGQNLLQHSREVAKLCATMAAELGLNVKLAKRAGLLHDIGKVYHEEPDLPHALLGMELAKKYKENPEVCNAIGAHHDEIEMTSIISPIIQACDAISGSRPGARREVMESYIKRLKELEALATNFDGVNKCYAIQAGRELRVIVDADSVTDDKANALSFDIAQKIERDMQYPGQIKITVIREMRAVSYAK